MRHILAMVLIITFMILTCSACANKTPSSQTPESQEIINENIVITESEVEAFFDEDDEFATNMLQYPVADMTNLEDVMLMILYPLGSSDENPVSFSEFNSYTMKYLNKSYSESDFEIFATEENVAGINVNMSKQTMYFLGLGDGVLAIDNIEIVGNDTAVLTCAQGFNWYEIDTIDEVMFSVQFGRANSKLYIISITKK